MLPRRHRAVFASPGFRLLWAGTALSELGSNIGRLAFILLVHEIALADGADPEWRVALVMALETLPMMLLGPIAGALIDRFDRRFLLVLCNALSALILVSIPTLADLDARWPLFGAALCFSAVGTVFHPTRLSAIPDLVPREHLAEANSVSTVTSGVMLLAAMALLAPMILVFGKAGSLWADSLAFAASGCTLVFLRLPRHNLPARHVRAFVDDVLAGIAYVSRRRVLVFLTAVYFISYGFVGAWWPILPSFVREVLGQDPDRWTPALIGSFGAGGLAGGALAPIAGRRLGLGRALVAALCANALLVVLFACAEHPWVSLALIGLGGAAIFSLLVLDATLVQRESEPYVRGRVFGAREPMRAAGMLLATALVMGFARKAEPQTLMLGAALGYASAVALATLLLPGARVLSRGGERDAGEGGAAEEGSTCASKWSP